MAVRARAFVFTYNNYPDTSLVDGIECKYMIYGKEVASTGTPHLQGYVYFENQKSFKSVLAMFPGCHVEIAKGSPDANYRYCSKEGDFTERGIRPRTPQEKGKMSQEQWREIRHAAEEGRFDEIPEQIRFMHKRLVEDHYMTALKKRKLDTEDGELINEWYWGLPGTGKTKYALDENPDAYPKMCNKWWDGYELQEVVIIDDFDKKHDVLGHHIKIWSDRYPFLAEVKGGSFKIRPKKIIVTSNWHPNQIWTDPETLGPILRRFKVVQFFGTLGRDYSQGEFSVDKEIPGRVGSFHPNLNLENQ